MVGNGFGIKRIATGACALLLAASLGGCSLLTPSRADVTPDPVRTKLTEPAIATKGVLTVGLAKDDAPQVLTTEDGQLTGYLVDLSHALAKRLGLEVTFVPGADPSSAGSSGEPDLYLGAASDDATDSVSISSDVLEDAPALFMKVDEGAEPPSSLAAEDLADAAIAVQTGSASQDTLSKCGIDAEQKPYANVNECLEALASGEVDYALCEATAGAYLARAQEGVRFVGTIDATTTYGIAMRTVNSDLVSAVTDAMSELSSDGTLDAIHTLWYGDLPVSLSDTMVDGITTSAEREAAEKAAEEAKKAEEEAKAEEDEQADAQQDEGDGSSEADAETY